MLARRWSAEYWKHRQAESDVTDALAVPTPRYASMTEGCCIPRAQTRSVCGNTLHHYIYTPTRQHDIGVLNAKGPDKESLQ